MYKQNRIFNRQNHLNPIPKILNMLVKDKIEYLYLTSISSVCNLSRPVNCSKYLESLHTFNKNSKPFVVYCSNTNDEHAVHCSNFLVAGKTCVKLLKKPRIECGKIPKSDSLGISSLVVDVPSL